MIKFFKNEFLKKRFLLFVCAILIFLLVLGFVIFNLAFLIAQFHKALGVVLEPTFSGGFDIEGFLKLNLINR